MSFEMFSVVILDDDQDIVDALSEDFAGVAGEVHGFTSEHECAEFLKMRSKRVGLMVCDFRLGEMNAFKFKEMVNQIDRSIPFVLVTGFWDKEVAVESMKLGIKGIYEKPFVLDNVLDEIKVFLEQRASSIEEDLEMVDGFLVESEDMLEDIENLILEIEDHPDDKTLLDTYFRLLHTIKGTSACVGLDGLSGYAHKYEDFISKLRDNPRSIGKAAVDIFLVGLDGLKQLYEHIKVCGGDTGLDLDTSVFERDIKESSPPCQVVQASGKSSDQATSVQDPKQERMTVALNVLDEFMEESGELTVLRNSIVKAVKKLEPLMRGSKDFEILNDLLEGMHQVTTNIQNKITALRKRPMNDVVRPYKRLVRDLSKGLDKKVGLEIVGGDVEIDTAVGKALSNCVVHMLRNSLDHGLELPSDRAECGKSEEGKICISSSIRSETIHVKIEDDGRGIDPNILSDKAIEKGLYTKEQLGEMDSSEIFQILFESGFSTAKEVTDVSGRGVGMDMVRSSIEELGGKIQIDSELGKGTTFHLEIPEPKSVMIINSLLVHANDQTVTIPMDDVIEVMSLPVDQIGKIHRLESGLVLDHADTLFPVVDFSSFLGRASSSVIWGDYVILRSKGHQFALKVDDVLEFEEVVLKAIPGHFNQHELFKGAALLGSGEISLIIDTHRLATMTLAEEKTQRTKRREAALEDGIELNGEEYIVFDVGTERLCIQLSSVVRLEQFDKSQIQQSGGQAVARYMDRTIPVSYSGAQDVLGRPWHALIVSSKGRPVAMLVDDLLDICTSDSEVDELEGAYLGCVSVNGKTIAVLDPDELEPLAISSRQPKAS